MRHQTGKRKTVKKTQIPKICRQLYGDGSAKSIILLIRSLVLDPINFQKCHGMWNMDQVSNELRLGLT
jgi:hypothetical protein